MSSPESHAEAAKPLTSLSGIGPKRAQQLSNLGIRSVGDLLRHVPKRYLDRTKITTIAEVVEGDTVTIQARVTTTRNIRLRGRNSIAEVTFTDESGSIKATWFGRGFLANTFSEGTCAFLTGTVSKYGGLALKNPEYEILSEDDDTPLNAARIVPVYALTEGITQKMLRKWIYDTLHSLGPKLPETLPPSIRKARGLAPIYDALKTAHFPESIAEAEAIRTRFAYEEFYSIQEKLIRKRAARRGLSQGHVHPTTGPIMKALKESLPFDLTGAQHTALDVILGDMAAPYPMGMLLQGDVGSGKTIVAFHAVAAALDGGTQAAIMAPTEILAEQHFLGLRKTFGPLGISVELLTGSTPNAPDLRGRLASGELRVVVGTHALFQDTTQFDTLGLVIVDEQHRFGVMQRHRLAAKGSHPDILHMTATPIPRTLTLTLYGAMDLAIINELPPGRMPIKTRHIPREKEAGLYEYIHKQAAQGLQTYFICPLIDESETKNLAAATTRSTELSDGPLRGLSTALLHGRLTPEEKDTVMSHFYAGDIQVLFSTTVIEVGIDVPTATCIVIDDASQFGLTQLHQLRGRVGRGTHESFCFLLGDPKTEDGAQRLDVICSTNDGFKIAEADLQLRGPGQLYGQRQSGIDDLRVADLLQDFDLLEEARSDALAEAEKAEKDANRPDEIPA